MAKRPIYYDTETTGTKADKDRIIELAAFDPVLNKSFVEFINPQMLIPEDSTAIHHITDEMVKNAPTFEVVISKFIDFCQNDVVLIAHNNDAFDKPFFDNEFKRFNLSIPTNWLFLDSLKWARKYRPDLPRHSLQYLREVYEIKANQAHRALDDVMVLYQVFQKMIDDLSIETVLELLAEKSLKKDGMPFGKYAGQDLKDVPKSYVSWLNKEGVFDKPENQTLKENFQKLGVL